MTFSSLLFLCVCWGFYKLGALNERQPGEVWLRATIAWRRLCELLKKTN